MSGLTSLALDLDKDIKHRLKRLAKARDQPPRQLLNEAIAQYLSREEKNEALRQETLEALSDYEATGLHATGEEVIAWLETWGDENEFQATECHR